MSARKFTPMSMINTPYLATFLAIVLLPVLTKIQGQEAKVVGVQDGIELIVSTVVAPGELMPTLECRLHNTTDQDIHFDLSGPTFRLSFKLLDASGAEIPMDAEWKRLNAWGDDAPNARHSSATITPGASRTFAFRTGDAYGELWKSGRRLLVSWEPGIDWSTEKPYTRGRGLFVDLNVHGAASEASEVKKTKVVLATNTLQHQDVGAEAKPSPIVQPLVSAAKPTMPPASGELPSSTPWSIIAVLFVAAGGLLWLLLKRHS